MKGAIETFRTLGQIFCFTLVLSLTALARQQSPAVVRQLSPAEALVRYEKLLQASSDQARIFHLRTKAAPAALAAGETEKAKGYAHALLEQAAEMRRDWNYGNAIQVGNLVLGRIALASGDVTEAKRLLLEAGRTPGSPQLNSFGPNMLLAKELLAKGEREAVIQYFDLCAQFWKIHEERLGAWKAAVLRGETPDFRANLSYLLVLLCYKITQ